MPPVVPPPPLPPGLRALGHSPGLPTKQGQRGAPPGGGAGEQPAPQPAKGAAVATGGRHQGEEGP
eukprot:5701862-Alexandrium_andersonii.AAC.1